MTVHRLAAGRTSWLNLVQNVGVPTVPCSHRLSCILYQRVNAGVTDNRRNYSACQVNQPLLPNQKVILPVSMLPCRHKSSYLLADYIVDGIDAYINFVHDSTGLPWWASLPLAVVPVRITIGFFIWKMKLSNSAKQHKIDTYHAPKLKQKLMSLSHVKNKKLKDPRFFQEVFKKAYKKKCLEERVSPRKQEVSLLLTLPIWMFTSSTLYRMTGDERGLLRFLDLSDPSKFVGSLATEGFLWIPDLLMPDQLGLLKVVLGVTFFTSLQINWQIQLMRSRKSHFEQGKGRMFMHSASKYGMLLYLIFIIPPVPAFVQYYWCLSSLTGSTVTLLLLSPKVRYLVNIRKFPADIDNPNPFRFVARGMKEELLFFRYKKERREEYEKRKYIAPSKKTKGTRRIPNR